MSEIKTPIEFLNEEYLQELGNGSLSKHASWKHECGVLMSTYDAKQIIDYVNRIKEQTEKLKKAVKQLLPMAEFSYEYSKKACAHQEFLSESRDAIYNAHETLKSCES